MEISNDKLLGGFLKECRKRGLHVFVARIVPPEQSQSGKVVMAMMSTEDDVKSEGFWGWMTKFHEYAIEPAAQALFVATGHATADDVDAKWAALDGEARQGFAMLAKAAFDVARGLARVKKSVLVDLS